MLSFLSDYTDGAHPKPGRLALLNAAPQPGYGEDEFCRGAKEKIRCALGREARYTFLPAAPRQTLWSFLPCWKDIRR